MKVLNSSMEGRRLPDMNCRQFKFFTRQHNCSVATLLLIGFFLIFSCLRPSLGDAHEYVFPSEPQLRINPAMHTALIFRVDLDSKERFAVTASRDKSVLVWDIGSGQMLKRLRLPAAGINIGMAYSVAISPDGEQIAVGGWTGNYDHNIYIYQRTTGVISRKITGLESVTHHLAYSPNGRYLAATMGLTSGLHVYSTTDYKQIYADRDYQGSSYWVSWQSNTCLVTSSKDGKIRLYKKGTSNWTLANSFDTGKMPFGLAVHPDGKHMAVGFCEDTDLLLLKLPSLQIVAGPPTDIVDNGDIATVSWSHNGDWLWAGGLYQFDDGYNPILCWRDAKDQPVSFPITTSTVADIRPLANGDLLVASADGLTRISAQGEIRWQHLRPLADFRGQRGDQSIRLSHDGSRVAFGFKEWGEEAVWWDLFQNKLWTDSQHPPQWDKQLQGAITESEGVSVSNWINVYHPTLNGRKLSLEEWETSRSLAIAPDRQGFVLGTEWYLRRFDLNGKQVWQQDVPEIAYAVAISGDGRWLVAGLYDGTLRWYDYRTGEEQLAFFPHSNRKDWVSWTPEGFFASSSPVANHLFGYQLNNGSDAPNFIGAEQLYKSFYRPDLVLDKFERREEQVRQALTKIGDVHQVLESRPPSIVLTKYVSKRIESTLLTLPITITDQGGGIGKLSISVNGVLQSTKSGTRKRRRGIHQDYELSLSIPADTTSTVEITATDAKGRVDSDALSLQVTSTAQRNSQKPKLVGLAIGIENYKDGSFKLNYAIDDIKALKKALEDQGKSLYERVDIEILPDATYDEIVEAFKRAQERVTEDDVFVLYLSGHGVTDNGNYHYLAQDFIWTSPNALEEKTIDSNHINGFLAGIRARKAVTILDTCYAGSFNPEIESLIALKLVKRSADDKQAVSRMMLEQKTVVERLNQLSGRAFFYASTNHDVALEGYNNHGLYTALLLQGLRSAPSVDKHISLSELRAYLEDTMPDVSEKHFKVRLYPMAYVPANFNFATK